MIQQRSSSSFLQEALVSSSGMGRNAHFLMLSKAFPLPTTELPTLQGALRDGFGEAVVVCDMPKPRKFLPLDIYQKRFMWTHKEVDLALHPVVGLVLQIGDKKFPHALGFQSLDFFPISKKGPCFTAIEEYGGG